MASLLFGRIAPQSVQIYRRNNREESRETRYFFRDEPWAIDAQGDNKLLGQYNVFGVSSTTGPDALKRPFYAKFVGEKGCIGLEIYEDNHVPYSVPFNPFGNFKLQEKAVDTFEKLLNRPYSSEAHFYVMNHPANQKLPLFQELYRDTVALRNQMAKQPVPQKTS